MTTPNPNSSEVPTLRSIRAHALATLGDAAEINWMLERATGYNRAELLTNLDEPVNERVGVHIEAMLDRRSTGEPLQYVLARWSFRTLELFLDQRVLIPRPETEIVVQHAIDAINKIRTAADLHGDPRSPFIVVDLGTGSGAIALSIAVEVDDTEVHATDASSEALAVARANLAGIGGQVAKRVSMHEGSWFDALPNELRGSVDLIISNPPYIASDEYETLDASVRDFEPAMALSPGPTGLESYEAIIPAASNWLRRGGYVVLEHSPGQEGALERLAVAAGFSNCVDHRDLADRARCFAARAVS